MKSQEFIGNHMKWKEIKWNHMKSYEINWNQMKSTEIKWNHIKFERNLIKNKWNLKKDWLMLCKPPKLCLVKCLSCRKMSSGDHCALSFSFMEKNNKSSAKGCMKYVKHSMSNAKDCKQDGTVKKHKRSEKKKVQITHHQCQDFYVKKEL